MFRYGLDSLGSAAICPFVYRAKIFRGGSVTLDIFTAAAAIAALAECIRRATEQLAVRLGPALAGLLTVSFGSIAEFVLALFVLIRGETGVVQAQITGSIIGTSLFGLGLAIFYRWSDVLLRN